MRTLALTLASGEEVEVDFPGRGRSDGQRLILDGTAGQIAFHPHTVEALSLRADTGRTKVLRVTLDVELAPDSYLVVDARGPAAADNQHFQAPLYGMASLAISLPRGSRPCSRSSCGMSPVVLRADSASKSSVVPTALTRYLLWAVLVVYAASSVRSVVRLIPAHRIRGGIMGPWFYLDYSDGFVRRGLPGELLRLIWGPSPVSVEIVGWAISFVAAAAMIFIALRIGSLAQRPGAGLVATTIVLITPLGITTIIRDPGRGDYIGMTAMAAMLLVATTRRPSPAVAVCAAALGTAIAVASQEFLIAFLAPVVGSLLYVTVRVRSPTGTPGFAKHCAKLISFALLPAIALTVASAVTKPSSAYLHNLHHRSHPQAGHGADWELGQSLGGVMEWVLQSRGLGAIIATTSIWGLVYLVTVLAIRIVVGRLGTWYWISATYFALVAATSTVALDVRRWWTLGLVSHLVVTGILASHDRPPREETSAWVRRARYAVPLAFLVLLYGQALPNTVRPSTDSGGAMSSYVGPGYVRMLVPFWLHGKETL